MSHLGSRRPPDHPAFVREMRERYPLDLDAVKNSAWYKVEPPDSVLRRLVREVETLRAELAQVKEST